MSKHGHPLAGSIGWRELEVDNLVDHLSYCNLDFNLIVKSAGIKGFANLLMILWDLRVSGSDKPNKSGSGNSMAQGLATTWP